MGLVIIITRMVQLVKRGIIITVNIGQIKLATPIPLEDFPLTL